MDSGGFCVLVVLVLTPVVLVLLTSCGAPRGISDVESAPPSVVPTAPSPAAVKRAPAEIQTGETLDVFVMEDDSFSGSYQVRSTGYIIIPKLGRVKVAGLPVSGAEKAVTQELQKNTLTEATVLIDRADLATKPGGSSESAQPARPPGIEIFLAGKVSRPGRYTMTAIANAPPTVHQAILQAGGCTRFAHKRKAHVLRKVADGRLQRIDADLLAIESGLARDIPLAPGDIIVVPEKKVDFGL